MPAFLVREACGDGLSETLAKSGPFISCAFENHLAPLEGTSASWTELRRVTSRVWSGPYNADATLQFHVYRRSAALGSPSDASR